MLEAAPTWGASSRPAMISSTRTAAEVTNASNRAHSGDMTRLIPPTTP